MSERERKANECMTEARQKQESGEELDRYDIERAFLAAWDAAIEAAAKVAEDDGCYALDAVAISKAIRALGRGEQKAGGTHE